MPPCEWTYSRAVHFVVSGARELVEGGAVIVNGVHRDREVMMHGAVDCCMEPESDATVWMDLQPSGALRDEWCT